MSASMSKENQMNKTTWLLVVAAVCLGAGFNAVPALAHVEVKKTKGNSKSASVTFTGPLKSGSIKVKGPDGKAGSGGIDPRKVSRLATDLEKGLKAGSYTAKWKITAADGHAQSGSFSFSIG